MEGERGGNGPLDCATACANRCAKVCHRCATLAHHSYCQGQMAVPKSTGRSLITPPADDGISLSCFGGEGEVHGGSVQTRPKGSSPESVVRTTSAAGQH